MKPANQGELLHKPHVYVKRADGSSGYEPAPDGNPSAADLDAVAEEMKVREATRAAWDQIYRREATNGGTE